MPSILGYGVVHKRRRQLGVGKGSKIGQNCRRIVLKNCQHGGGGCQNSWKIADVVYGWSLLHHPPDSFFMMNSRPTVLHNRSCSLMDRAPTKTTESGYAGSNPVTTKTFVLWGAKDFNFRLGIQATIFDLSLQLLVSTLYNYSLSFEAFYFHKLCSIFYPSKEIQKNYRTIFLVGNMKGKFRYIFNQWPKLI